jgi:hypothetical protein
MKTINIKTSELSGVALDYCVAFLEDQLFDGENDIDMYSPSTDWAQGGPIIEREGVTLVNELHLIPASQGWRGQCGLVVLVGKTPLIAAMRCYVASKLGECVNIPAELAC